jgi:hypothetical protein
MDSAVIGQFRVEGGGEDVALADKGGVGCLASKSFAGGEDLDAGTQAGDPRGADEDHFERAAGQSGFGVKDRGVVLAAIGVALNSDVQSPEGRLCGVFDVFGEEDAAGAGAEGGLGVDELVKYFVEAGTLKVFEKGCGLPAGEDEGVEEAKFFGFADEHCIGAELCEAASVDFEGALEGENTDGGNGAGHGQGFSLRWIRWTQ